MKKLIVLLSAILCLQTRNAYSQKGDYIETDSALMVGVKLIASVPKFNSQYIVLKEKKGETKYTPNDIKEYGFKDGTVYESKTIIIDNQEKRVFLERLAYGTLTLYRYVDAVHETFYITKGNELTEVFKDLQAIKSATNDCQHITNPIKLVRYKKESLRELVQYYNDCERKAFPYKKFGILAGLRQMTLIAPSNFSYEPLPPVSMPSTVAPIIGVFADFPLKMTDFSFHCELFFAHNSVAANAKNGQFEADMLITYSGIQAPLLVRYAIPTPTWRVFFDAGPYFSYNIENSSALYYATIDNGAITIQRPPQKQILSDFLFGFSLGTGIQRNLNYRKTISAEIRYTRAYGPDDTTLIQSGLDLILGFTF